MLSLDFSSREKFHDLAFSTLLYPVQLVAFKVNRIRDVIDENRKLLVRNANLRLENDEYAEAALENARLRHFLGLRKREKYPTALAQVISLDPGRNHATALLDRGENDGIVGNMPVITPKGLVGRISRVSPLQSVLQFLKSPSTKVSVIERSSRTVGILQSIGGVHLRFSFPAHSTVKTGDTLVTSGYGGVYPKCIRVGVLGEIFPGQIPVLKEADVFLFQNPASIEEVFILLKKESWKIVEGEDGE